MIHGDSSRPRSSSETWVARAIPAVTRASVVALLLASGASLGAGCDSSNDSDQPFPEFEGRWAVDVDKSSVTCQQTDIGMQAISPWSDPPTAPGESLGVVTIEAGVLTDLVETSSECLFGYNVNPKIAEATVANPDPYTGSPAKCVMTLPRQDGSNLVLLSNNTQSPLTFQLEKPVKGMAQVADLTGAAEATVNLMDDFGNLTTYEGCTFAAQAKLHKIAKP